MVSRKKILICGYYGFANAGDEAMLMAVIEALNSTRKNLDITVLSGNPSETTKRHNVKAVHRLNIFAIIKAILKSDMIISGGGSLLQDVTSRRSIFYYLGIMQLSKLFFKPVMLYGQGIGPIRGSLARFLTSIICKQIDLISVRDSASKKELETLGIKSNKVYLTADPVMAMGQVERISGKNILRKYKKEEEKLIIGISPRAWQNLSDFKKQLADAADILIERYKAKIIFMPLQYPEDVETSLEIKSFIEKKEDVSVVKERCTIQENLSLVGNMDVLIGIRLHALIFAALMGTPVIGISYDPKIEGFLEGIGLEPIGNVKSITAQHIVEQVEIVMSDDSFLRKQNKHVEKLREEAMKNAKLAVLLLDSANK